MFESKFEFYANFTYADDYFNNNHEHPCYELVYYLSGSGTTVTNGMNQKFAPDTFTLIRPKTIHSEHGSKDTEVLYIGFTLLEGEIPLKDGLYKADDFPVLQPLLCIKHEMENKKGYFRQMLNLLTDQIVILLSRNDYNETAEDKLETLTDAVRYIDLNYMKNISIKEIANSIGYSYDYFRHLFKQYMGITAKEYVLKLKLNYAKKLLAQTEYKKQDVAQMCGFSSLSHFNQVFKDVCGMLPGSYREKAARNREYAELKNYDVPQKPPGE